MKTFYSQNFLMVVVLFLFVLGTTVDLAANPIFGPVQPFNVAFPVQQPNGQVRLEQRTVATMLVQWIAPQPIGRNAYGQIIYQNRQFQARYIIQIFAVPVGFNPYGNMIFQPVPCPIGIVGDNGVAIATIPNPPVPQLEPIILPPSPQLVQHYQQNNYNNNNLPALDTSLDYRAMLNNNSESVADFNQRLNNILSSVSVPAPAVQLNGNDSYSISNFQNLMNANLAQVQALSSDPQAQSQFVQQWENVGNIAGSLAKSYEGQGKMLERTRLERQWDDIEIK